MMSPSPVMLAIDDLHGHIHRRSSFGRTTSHAVVVRLYSSDQALCNITHSTQSRIAQKIMIAESRFTSHRRRVLNF